MTSIEESLAAAGPDSRAVLERVLQIAREVAPDAEEGMSYGMPALRVAGKPYFAVAVAASHLSLFPFSPAAIDAVRERLEGYSLSKGTVRFTAERPVPEDVVRDIAIARLSQIR